MRIVLINPISRRTEGYHTIGSRIPQLGLQVLAHLVPDGHEGWWWRSCGPCNDHKL